MLCNIDHCLNNKINLDSSGKTTVLSAEQVKRGKRLFNASCGSCHTGGITKTNPNIGLDTEGLSLATPNRNSVAGLVDYMKNVYCLNSFCHSLSKRMGKKRIIAETGAGQHGVASAAACALRRATKLPRRAAAGLWVGRPCSCPGAPRWTSRRSAAR